MGRPPHVAGDEPGEEEEGREEQERPDAVSQGVGPHRRRQGLKEPQQPDEEEGRAHQQGPHRHRRLRGTQIASCYRI